MKKTDGVGARLRQQIDPAVGDQTLPRQAKVVPNAVPGPN